MNDIEVEYRIRRVIRQVYIDDDNDKSCMDDSCSDEVR